MSDKLIVEKQGAAMRISLNRSEARARAGLAPITEIQAYHRQPRRAPKRQSAHGVARPFAKERVRVRALGSRPPDFDELYARYFQRLCLYVQRIMCDPHAAEEVCQQTFIRVWRALPRFREDPDGSLEGWLYTIARRCALNEIKKRREELTIDPAKLHLSEPFDVRAVTRHWIENEDLGHRFDQLSLLQRQVLTLRYLFDMSCAEAAETLGRTTTCVTSVEHRARRALSRSAASASDQAHAA